MISALAGFIAGSAHVVTGPDHLAALAPIAVDQPRKAMQLGLRWGLGHGLGVILLGALGVFARSSVDVDAISAWSEFMVGFMLIAVGVWALRRTMKMVIHTHAHDHQQGSQQGSLSSGTEPDGHSHFHVHATADGHETAGAHKSHSHAAFVVGMLHGAAGTGHLLGVLPSLALPTFDAIIYLAAYFVSAVLSMACFGAILGVVTKNRGPIVLRKIMYASSTAAIVIGVVWIGQTWNV